MRWFYLLRNLCHCIRTIGNHKAKPTPVLIMYERSMNKLKDPVIVNVRGLGDLELT